MVDQALLRGGSLVRFFFVFMLLVIVLGVVTTALPGGMRDLIQTFAGPIAGFGAAMYIGQRFGRETGRFPGVRERLVFSAVSALLVFAVLAAVLALLLSGRGALEGSATADLTTAIAIGFPIVFSVAVSSIFLGLSTGLRRGHQTA